MAPKLSKPPKTLNPSPTNPNPPPKTPNPPPKTPKESWKTGEQLEFLLSRYTSFERAQDAQTLDRFWLRLFEDWYHRWKLPSSPTPELLRQYGTMEEARFMIQTKKNAVRSFFH